MYNKIIAIDPGDGGSIVLETKDGVQVNKMPDTPKGIFELLKVESRDFKSIAYMERIFSMPGNSGSSMLNFGTQWGHLEMGLVSLDIEYQIIQPQKWMKFLQVGTRNGMKQSQWKNKLKERAIKEYPDLKIHLYSADALLILKYAKEKLKERELINF